MKKFNKRINRENEKSKKKISRELKTKLGNLEIKPQFLIIGLVAIITIISLIYLIFLKYSPIMNFKYEGYAVRGKEITKNLLGEGNNQNKNSENSEPSDNDEKNIDLAKIEEQGTIFKKLGQYFIGSKEKTEIDLSYPIYINDKNTIYNLNQDMLLISKSFEQVAGYPNISITDGKVYNGNSLERADSKEYIFAKTEEGIYINLKEIKISTTANEYVIPINSLIAFEEDVIRYYATQNNTLIFKEINDVDYNSQVAIKNIDTGVQNARENSNIQNTQNAQNNVKKVDNTYNYEELLTRLGIIGNAKNDVENSQEEIQKEDTSENKPEKDDNDKEDKKENETNSEEDENQQAQQQEQENNETSNQENKYIKPEVTAEEFTAEVYSAKSTLTIKDPTARILEAPTFEIYKDGKIYLRRTYTQSGEIIVTGLDADTEYEIIGKYIYKNEEDKKIENTFFKETLKTKGYEALGTIKLSKEEGEIYNNKIQIKNVRITSNLQNEVIKGIDTVELKTGSIKTVLKNNKVNELLAGKEITIESSEGLKSNENIDYELKFYDKKGKELKVENNKGKTRTSKQEPKVTIKIKEQDIVSVTLGLKLSNKDNVKLENYKYIVRKPNGEIEKEERLSQNQKEIKLDDLDSNQYYSLKIYADYDLNNNKGKQEQVEIGDLIFATQPLSTLGSVELKVEGKGITTNKATLTYEIDEERTDKRLIQILNSIKVELINKNTGKVAKTTTIQEEELQILKSGQKLEKTYENLVSNTTYEIKITSKVKPGTKEENAPVTYSYQSFTTVKMPAKVEIQNKFVTKDLIDLDVRIDDKDNAISNNKVRMELRDEKNTLVETSEVKTNKDWLRKTYNKLEENKTYTLKFYADEYNEGHTDATYKRNYLLKEIDILTEEGITGKIDLKSMLKKTTGKNLVDPDSKIKWYTPYIGINGFYQKSYDEETNILKLGLGRTGNNQSYVYDLREYIGKEVTISFKIKADEGITTYIQNAKTGSYGNRTKINGVSKEDFKEYKQTLIVNDTGYVGFWIINGTIDENASVYIKDLQIELGNTKTEYEEYKYNMESKVLVNLEDKRDEIITNDYYIKIYEDGKLVDTKKYENFPDNNKIENAEKELNIKENHEYKLELAVRIRLRDYVISTFEFNTKNGEILGITTEEEYKDIQPEGNYIVLDDLDFRNEESNANIQNSVNIPFNGTINFNGHTVYKKYLKGSNAPMFYVIGEKGKIENIVLNINFTEDLATSGNNLFYTNNGTISNMYLNIEGNKDLGNGKINFIGQSNNGEINNFIVNFRETVYANEFNVIVGNSGTIENGYMFGKNLKKTTSVDTGLFINDNGKGKIRNMFSLVSIDEKEPGESKNITNIARFNSAIIENIYTVGVGNAYNINSNPNVLNGSAKNSYYINDKNFKGTSDKKITNKALWDKNFQNKILNTSNNWEVDELVNLGYYPWLKLNDCMPRQEYIALPEMTDADLPEILFTETLENTNKTARVKISVYNPSGEEITNITVKNLECTIESQEYKDGRSELIVNLSNPIQCVSTYSILSFTTKGAYNLEYTKEYKEGEILINVELFNEIYTVEDWYAIRKKNSENYKLMANLDFKNADVKQYAGMEFYGVLDGGGNTIKNIYIPESKSIPLFRKTNLNTKILNLNIKNYNLNTNKDNGALIHDGNGFIMKDVNIDTVNIKINSNYAYVYAGAIIGQSYDFSLENLTMNNINIYANTNGTLYMGGLVGHGYGNISNVKVCGLNLDTENSTNVYGVGGIIGSSGSYRKEILNCIVNGKITTKSGNAGGILGNGYICIKNCISKMNIVADGHYVGGIIGNVNYPNIYINNLYIGNIINKKDTIYVDAIKGNNAKDGNNYIYNKNKINGLEINDYPNKLSKEDLSKENTYKKILMFDENYNYDDLNNKLPLLNKLNKKEVLPNQETIYIENEEMEIKNVSTLREDGNRLKIRLEIANPKNLEITGVQIENMDLDFIDNRNNNGIAYIDLIGTPTKHYDNYQITKINYLKEDKEITQDTYYLIEEIFYKEITKYEDWQNIDKESFENYKLLTDLDFSGKQNVNYNLKISRLITEGSMHTIKNFSLNVGKYSNFGLIGIVKNEIRNINFENIQINSTDEKLTVSNVGVIGKNEGTTNKVTFNNININVACKITNLGSIGYNFGSEVEEIKGNDIYISTNNSNNVGGIIGKIENGLNINNISAENINISGKGINVGGVAGRLSIGDSSICKISNWIVQNSEINGKDLVGGAIGIGDTNGDILIDKVKVKGETYVGGFAGEASAYWPHCAHVRIENSEVRGIENVGGISGYGRAFEECYVRETLIEGISVNSENVGGIFGKSTGYMACCYIYDSKIISKGINVGGITGLWTEQHIEKCYAYNNTIEGYANVGGITGNLGGTGIIRNSYNNSSIVATAHSAGGITGYLENSKMNNIQNRTSIYSNYYAGGIIQANEYIGGVIGEIAKGIYNEDGIKRYYSNYVDANLICEGKYKSIGIGNMPIENIKFVDNYYYKYSAINGEHLNNENEPYIRSEQYLDSNDLSKKETYLEKLKWGETNYDYEILKEDKYPILKHNKQIIEGQEGIPIPKDPTIDNIAENIESDNLNNISNTLNNLNENLKYTFNYNGKIIRTYETSSEIISEDKSRVVRNDVLLYVKNGNLYALPVNLENNNETIKFITNNFIIDSFNGKEYETVLGTDGKLYDLKEPLKYPENFVNEDIASIGNNLENSYSDNNGNMNNEEFSGIDKHEIEVTYKNGNKVNFNYQTGEVISSIEEKSNKTGLFDYVKEKISQIGNSRNIDKTNKELKDRYEESKVLQKKLEETSVEEVLQRKNSNTNKADNIATGENGETNNSLKEKKYINIYNVKKGNYQIYQEEELLDTTKQEVISENEKIEANNLKEYYASEGEAKNMKMGIVWIALSIVGVLIILFAIKKRD